ncbi:MAG TPA: hypothetical protein DEA22_08550 [Blastocatellia bacterium]|nr:hypothetical protein [Blastocatellia bacterium]
MKEKFKVKVIKKGKAAASVKSGESPAKTKRAAAREMVSTVSNWVNELQARKRDETRFAIEKFLSRRPQPNET